MKANLIIAFGSQVRETSSHSSDLDVAVLSDHLLNLKEKSELTSKLASKLKIIEDKIDLVDLWTAPPLLQYQVANNGQLLEGDEFEFLRFRVLAWKRYLDTAKFRRAREKALANRHAQ